MNGTAANVGFNYNPRSQFLAYHNRTQRYAVLLAHRRSGKRLALDTPIPLASGGFRDMGALVAGDMILDETGSPTMVTVAHPIEENTDAYRVIFDDGSSVVADAEHLWLTRTKLDRAHKNEMIRRGNTNPHQRPGSVKTTAEIAATLSYQGENNHTVDLTEPVLTPDADLPIDPYIFGLWLGDGATARFDITTMDWSIMERVLEYADEQGFTATQLKDTNPTGRALTLSLREGASGYHPNTLLRNLGVGGDQGVLFKHIPESYLAGSVAQRVALLRGIMDTDGSIDADGKMEITFKSRRLIDETRQLLCSLGVKVGQPRCKLVQMKGWSEPREYWRLRFTTKFCPFEMPRKVARWSMPHATRNESGKRFIVAAERIASVPMRCISVDSPSRLFLCTKDYIPTHNSYATLNDIIVRALTPAPDGLRQQFALMAPTQSQARTIAWQYLKDQTACFANCRGFNSLEQHLTVTLPDPKDTNKPGSTIMLVGAENAERLRGVFLNGIVIDEAADIPDFVVTQILRPALSDRQGWMTIAGTVKSIDDYLWRTYELAQRAPLLWFNMNLKASESGIIPDHELEDLRRGMSEEAYQVEFENNVHAAVTGKIFLPYMVDKQITKVPYDPAGSAPITGWDLGMSDSTAIWVLQMCGREPHILDAYEASGKSLDHYVEWLRKLPYVNRMGAHLLPHDSKVRELGSGKSRIQTLREMGLRNLKVVAKLPKDQQIEAARLLMPKCWFNEDTTHLGRKALRNYSFGFDPKRKVFSLAPLHDAHSNFSDAFQTLAVGLTRAMAVEGGGGMDDDALMGLNFDDERPVAAAFETDYGVF